MVVTASQSIEKQSGEKILISMDFVNRLTADETLSSPTVTVEGGSELLVTNTAISSTKVTCFINAGTAGKTYRLTFNVNTSLGQILQGDGLVKIRDR